MNNEIKNTLFRFVSMRAPELSTEYNKKAGFILQPESASGDFNDAVINRLEGTTKSEALKQAAIDFESSALSVDAIKKLTPDLYNFSVWVAKNRIKANSSEISDRASGLSDLKDHKKTIWQNLYYQVITQKDFYAKEVLMQLLLANHIVENYQTLNLEELTKAKIILPKALFVEGYDTNVPSGKKEDKKIISGEKTSFASPEMLKADITASLEANNKVLIKLKNELKNAEKIYKKEYQSKYEEAYQTYEEEQVKPVLEQYRKDLETAKNNWCSVKDPNSTYDPKDPCQQPPTISDPEIPKFKFIFHDELDDKFLGDNLSMESYEALDLLLNPTKLNKSVNNPVQDRLIQDLIPVLNFDTFEDSFNSIDQIIEGTNNGINENITEVPNSTILIGDTPIEVDPNISNLAPFEYELKSRTFNLFNTTKVLTLIVGIPNASWKISSISYKLTRPDDTFEESTTSFVDHRPGYDLFKNIPLLGITTDFKELFATVHFQNGGEKKLLISNVSLESVYKGFLLEEIEENEEPGTNPNNNTIDPDLLFIPSGFGVKQLGIADYNKVEQSIQGYIEGEVAHIENIMAREFKEKSTRRLRRQEDTTSSTSETEREQLTDTTSVDRFEMQSEVANVIQNSNDFSAGASVNASYSSGYELQVGAFANNATHNSSEESMLQAVSSAKEITERALDRIVNKVKEERIEKIVEEFEENNTHGFDNRKGDKHVVGVYRWTDKIFKNQIINYGKRLMFEFMVPEPAKLHKLAVSSWKNANILHKPTDPRTASNYKLESYADLTIDNQGTSKLKYWASKFNVELESLPKEYINVGKSFSQSKNDKTQGFADSKEDVIKIPESYEAHSVSLKLHGGSSFGPLAGLGVGSHKIAGGLHAQGGQTSTGTLSQSVPNYREEFPVSYISVALHDSSGTVQLKCKRTEEATTEWQQKTFNAIIKAYEDALRVYEEKLAEQKASGVQILGTNPGFYRDIENTILRKNCISYLLDNNPEVKRTFGKGFYKKNDNTNTFNFGNTTVNQNTDLDDYAAFVKFMEQAFEWNIMSYNFYPYYWADRDNWENMHLYNDTHDHIFKAFMQSGMARVIVTVRPGFEEAVRYYMQTGQIWNGGEVPVIEDELYLSIVDELRAPEGEKVGKAWWSRVPTALTILQAQSIGLNVTKALPFNEDLSDFEDPDSVPQSAEIELTEAQIGATQNTGTARLFGQITGNNGIEAKIVLKRIDGSIQDLTYTDTNGQWELNNLPAGRFELLLDADNDFPSDTYQVSSGSKEQVVELADDQTVQVDLTIDIIA
ncbi:carboxypeptidase-like regulatory domain-containing protein [Mesoflavibacter zeaxanthinifaciens]|uniref:carboxypeptidase-like regulatory domain-containing protein n=1 Tax=Mesoflavibacter zeaxanthinifaciens TaxID=393060 RepID=UPI003A94B109